MDTLISQYIDNELSLSEKKTFAEKIHIDDSYYEKTREILEQEAMLFGLDVYPEPHIEISTVVEDKNKNQPTLLKGVLFLGGGLVAASLLLIFLFHTASFLSPPDHLKSYRFVIYSPDANTVELTGTFTNWNRLLMERGAEDGYWHAMVSLSGGEHRFSYIIDGQEKITDPTLLSREKDDFGGENSILRI